MNDFTLPPVETANEYGLLVIGGELNTHSIIDAYKKGVFPWPFHENFPLFWFSPDPRGVIFTDNFHISKSLNKILRQKKFTITINQQFEPVIRHCQKVPRKGQENTWITESMIQACIQLHHQKHAYSIEVSHEGELVGGLYGINIGHFFSGESMFFLKTDASKVALITLLKIIKKIGCPFLDTQMVTPVTKSIGAHEIPRKHFIEEIKKLISQESVNLQDFF